MVVKFQITLECGHDRATFFEGIRYPVKTGLFYCGECKAEKKRDTTKPARRISIGATGV